MTAKHLVLFGLLLALSLMPRVKPASAQPMIANITQDIETDFGTYHPYPAVFFPSAPLCSVDSDFGNVANFGDVGSCFDAVDSVLLRQNLFTVRRSSLRQIYDIYNICTWDGTPIFITTDAVLHVYHVLFDNILAEIETESFMAMCDELTGRLIERTESVRPQVTKPLAQEALLCNLAFLYVGRSLLNGRQVAVPADVSRLVNDELNLIANHGGYHYSPIFGDFSKLDYSQFQPRGHYAQNDTLRAYFQTMMWYGWTIFAMEPEVIGEIASRHTLQALLLVQMIYDDTSDGQPLEELWEGIYEPTAFFAGRTDDPNVVQYRGIAERVYGPDFLSLSSDSLADSSLLEDFMSEARKLPEPAIPNWIYGTFVTYKGFRFMGQRFIPDSYMFAHLVDPEVENRLVPRGLDIMTILGSGRAYTLLDSVYGERRYPNYATRVSEFKIEFMNKPSQQWAQNLYWNWLYCLMPLLYEKGPGYPCFMQTTAWADKELMTALASWAELRHDTILYAKQSTTPWGGMPPGPPRSYIEPNPHLYARLAGLVSYTREGLQGQNLLPARFTEKLDLFEALLLFLRDVSIKELEDTSLSEGEYEDIFCFGRIMQYLVSDAEDPDDLWDVQVDDMAVVADVHTDSNTDRCLEEGVGYPLEIFVIVCEGGVTRVTRGAMLSYYEFTQPIDDRLTDEAWRTMFIEGPFPELPTWADGFANTLLSAQVPPQDYSPGNLYDHEFVNVEGGEAEVIPTGPGCMRNYPNPFNPTTSIQFAVGSGQSTRVTLKVFNVLGQEVRTLVDEAKEPGHYTVTWDGRDELGFRVASGVYLYRMECGGYSRAMKMILMR